LQQKEEEEEEAKIPVSFFFFYVFFSLRVFFKNDTSSLTNEELRCWVTMWTSCQHNNKKKCTSFDIYI